MSSKSDATPRQSRPPSICPSSVSTHTLPHPTPRQSPRSRVQPNAHAYITLIPHHREMCTLKVRPSMSQLTLKLATRTY
ncbi:hypothetical protein OBBRIDRAFT_501035 [Obba rivulosa]|uniref:Uncharacterized protein n=1 Tax=Obba rivulosa TaxID=1052685 RepID=A0A8E2J7X9_9APHY|nr:hypothetical protein OBBRIDRAFT_501035 [Obba rivulosa]